MALDLVAFFKRKYFITYFFPQFVSFNEYIATILKQKYSSVFSWSKLLYLFYLHNSCGSAL